MNKHEIKRLQRFSDLKKIVRESGYTLVSTEYNHSADMLHFICTRGHDYYNRLDLFINGKRCKKCYDQRIAEIGQRNEIKKKEVSKAKNKKMITQLEDNFRKVIEKEGYELVSSRSVSRLLDNTSTTGRSKVTNRRYSTICPKGHNWETTAGNWSGGSRCKDCSERGCTSKVSEDKMRTYLKSRDATLVKFTGTENEVVFICECGEMVSKSYKGIKKGYAKCNSCTSKIGKRKSLMKKITAYEQKKEGES